MNTTKIGWTQKTWNPTTGCDKVSKGCKFCYAEILAEKLEKDGNPRYQNGFKLTLHHDKVNTPRYWKEGIVIFVNSMSDLFHEDIPLEFIQKVFKTMNETPQHIYQILTKRSKRLVELSDKLTWTDNIWMGVSVEDTEVRYRIYDLEDCGAKTKFISAEPLLGPLYNLDLTHIDWVIVGGESGVKHRPMNEGWVIDILEHCEAQEVPFFFKQWGGLYSSQNGNLLLGEKYEAFPNGIKIIKK